MRISVITQYYKPEIGATPNRLYEMCKGLKSEGAEVSIITAMPNYPTGKIFNDYKNKFFRMEVIDDIEILRYWLYASNSKKTLPRIWSMITFSLTVIFSLRYLCKRKNDYLIVQSPPLTLAFSAWLLSCLSRTKLIINISDLWPLTAKKLGAIKGDSFIYKILEKLERFLYRHSVVCIGQSQEIINYMKTHGANNTYLFRNGVDPKRFYSSNSYSKGNKMRIVYTGLLGYAQGIANICKHINFSALNCEFHIYGAGGEQEIIEEYIDKHLDQGIYYHGKVTREEIPEILSQYDCTLIPLVKNIYGAVPSKIYESMASGLPILFSGGGEGANIIKTYNLGWVSHALDYEALKQNILIAQNSNDYDTIRNNCLSCATNKFNRPIQIKKLYQFLLSL